jgi:Citrate synthase, C-terminal domain
MKRNEVRSDIAWASPTQVVVHGLDLCEEIVGKIDFGQMAFLQLFARLPDERELRMFNAMMVILVEHGITPSSIATRMTYCGAPESVQAAVAAGLLGLGSVFVGSLDNAARLLQESLPDPARASGALQSCKGNRLLRSLRASDGGVGLRGHFASEAAASRQRDGRHGRCCIGDGDPMEDLPRPGGVRTGGRPGRPHPRGDAPSDGR